MLENIADAYREGHNDVAVAARTHRYDVAAAIRSWTEAQSDHGHTSYWGILHIRCMRAYWLGVARLQRQYGFGWRTYHLWGVARAQAHRGLFWGGETQ